MGSHQLEQAPRKPLKSTHRLYPIISTKSPPPHRLPEFLRLLCCRCLKKPQVDGLFEIPTSENHLNKSGKRWGGWERRRMHTRRWYQMRADSIGLTGYNRAAIKMMMSRSSAFVRNLPRSSAISRVRPQSPAIVRVHKRRGQPWQTNISSCTPI